jgi:peptidoglycan hydrolase-like protein with peptidoglycan-binding domain
MKKITFSLALLASLFFISFLGSVQHAYASHDSSSFAPAVTLAAPGGWWDTPNGPVSGDFNNDGFIDLAHPDYPDDTISVFLSNGDGTFASSIISFDPAGDSPFTLVAADFNNDNNLDVAAANNESENIALFLGEGDGTFASGLYFGSGNLSSGSMITADFNSDGFADLAVTNYDDATVAVLINNGDATFATSVSYAAGTNPYIILADDFNNDDNVDLVTTNSGSDNISVLLGNGDGTFDPAVNYATGDGPSFIAISDFNNDDDPDLAVVNSGVASGTVSIFLNNGDGTFTRVPVAFTAGDSPFPVLASDFDNDENMDLLVTNFSSDNVSVLLGNGDGTFDAAVNYAAGDASGISSIADFNSDGNIDIATTNLNSSNISVLLGNGDGTFDAAVNYAVGDTPGGQLLALDFNNDSKIDLATDTYAPGISVLLNNLSLPTVSFTSASGSGDESVTSPSVPVTLSAANDVDVTVDYTVTGGTATGGGIDYTLASGTLAIPMGDTTAGIPLSIIDDATDESDETIIITISSPVNALLDTSVSFTYTITNDDTTPVPESHQTTGGRAHRLIPVVPLAVPVSTVCNIGDKFSSATGLPCTSFLTPQPSCFIAPTLKFGSKGEEVKCLQVILKNLATDGIFGQKTKAAVINFQTLHGLVPDGIVGPLTIAVIRNIRI